jgi:hypothetical protein
MKPIHQMTLPELQAYAYSQAHEKGWYQDGDTPTIVLKELMLCVTELGEAVDPARDGSYYEVKMVEGKPEGFSIEMADALLRILGLCGMLQIPIEQAVACKVAYNATRPYKHGRKV